MESWGRLWLVGNRVSLLTVSVSGIAGGLLLVGLLSTCSRAGRTLVSEVVSLDSTEAGSLSDTVGEPVPDLTVVDLQDAAADLRGPEDALQDLGPHLDDAVEPLGPLPSGWKEIAGGGYGLAYMLGPDRIAAVGENFATMEWTLHVFDSTSPPGASALFSAEFAPGFGDVHFPEFGIVAYLRSPGFSTTKSNLYVLNSVQDTYEVLQVPVPDWVWVDFGKSGHASVETLWLTPIMGGGLDAPWLIYRMGPGPGFSLRSMKLDGPLEHINLFDDVCWYYSAPGSDYVLYATDDSTFDCHAVPINGGEPVYLVDGVFAPKLAYPRFLPGGDKVVLETAVKNGGETTYSLILADLTTGEHSVLAQRPVPLAFRLSADGTYLAFVEAHPIDNTHFKFEAAGNLYVLKVGTGEEATLVAENVAWMDEADDASLPHFSAVAGGTLLVYHALPDPQDLCTFDVYRLELGGPGSPALVEAGVTSSKLEETTSGAHLIMYKEQNWACFTCNKLSYVGSPGLRGINTVAGGGKMLVYDVGANLLLYESPDEVEAFAHWGETSTVVGDSVYYTAFFADWADERDAYFGGGGHDCFEGEGELWRGSFDESSEMIGEYFKYWSYGHNCLVAIQQKAYMAAGRILSTCSADSAE